MPAFKPLLLLAAALLLAASSGAAAEKARLLEDTWSQASYGAPHSSPHQPAEVLTTCLRATTYANCRFPNTNDFYFEPKVTCCSDAAANKDAFAESDIDIGSCAFDATIFDESIVVSATAEKLGTFIATCTLKNAASLCGTPFCEQMVLTAQGAIFKTENVVSYTLPDAPLVDESCRVARAGRAGSLLPVKSSAKSGKAPAGKKVAAAASAVAEDGGHAATEYYSGSNVPRTVYQGTAYIFSGPLTLHSRYYDVKWQGAHMEYTYDFTDPVAIDSDAAHDHYVVEPYTFKLSFTKPRGAPY